jgi:hypothetical protein
MQKARWLRHAARRIARRMPLGEIIGHVEIKVGDRVQWRAQVESAANGHVGANRNHAGGLHHGQ